MKYRAKAMPSAREAEADLVARRPALNEAPLGSRGGGVPLPATLRAPLEAATGNSLAAVRIHDGPEADRDARAVHARAYACGDDIVFAAGEFRPDTARGRELLTHELGHVLQQRRDGVARIDRQASDSPRTDLARQVRAVVRAAMVGSLTDRQPFWDRINQERTLDALVLDAAAVRANDTHAFAEQFALGVSKIGEAKATIELAAQDRNEVVDWDGAIKLLGKQLGNVQLGEFGLPTSFGTDLFVEYASEILAHHLAALVGHLTAAYAAHDPNTATLAKALTETLERELATMTPDLASALQYAIATWGDPFGLLELELEGAIHKLLAAREEMRRATTDQARAAAGKKLNTIARMILVIDQDLVPVAERKKRREAGERSKWLGATDAFGTAKMTVDAAHAFGPSEEATLQHRGNQLSELGGRDVAVQRPLFGWPGLQLETGVSGEEAYPHYSDQVALDGLRSLAAHAQAQAAELDSLRKQIVPERVLDLGAFSVVYKRWFGFYSSVARDQDPAFAFVNKLYRGGIMNFAAMGGPQGWIGRFIMTQTVGSMMPVGNTETRGFQGELDRIPFERRERTTGEVVGSGGGGSGIKYETAELTPGSSAPLSVGGEASARDRALADQSATSRRAFELVYAQPKLEDMIATASVYGRYHGTPAWTRFWHSASDLKSERTGFGSNWSYLMDTEVFTESLDLTRVHEHKVMRDEVARYLVARTQALGTHRQSHSVRDEYGGRVAELEKAKATAEARYVRGEDPRTVNPEAESLKATIRAAKAAIESNSPDALVFELERRMSDFFAYADPPTRVLAILMIAVFEDNLTEELLSGFNAKAIAWAVGIAAGISAVLYVLSLLGPLGQLAAAVIQRTLHKIGLSVNVAAVITIGQWAVNSALADSFGAAQRWAYIGADVAAEISHLMRDYAIAKVQQGLKWAWKWGFKTKSSNPGADINETFGKDPAGRQILDDLEASIRKALDAGDKGMFTKESIEFLKAADPGAYARLARDYPHIFTEVAPHPDLRPGSAAAELHILVKVGLDPKIAGRVVIVEVPGDSIRIRVKNGMIEVEVGRKVATDAAGKALVEGHIGSIVRLSRYVGPVGQVRYMLARVGAAIGFLTIRSRGGEAAEEIKKLTDIRTRLEKLRDGAERQLGKWAEKPATVSDAELDGEIARIQKQIDGYMLELDSTVIGKGYIAAEGNFAALEKAGILNEPLDVAKLEKLGYRVDKNNVIYRPKGGGATMEPLQVRDGKVVISDVESAAAVQARVYDSLPPAKKLEFDAVVAGAAKGTKVRLVEGVHDTGATWKEVFGSPTSVRGKKLRAELREILTKDGGLTPDKADELIEGLIARPDTIKVVLGTEPIRSSADYRKMAATADGDIAHHFDPLYLGGGHKLIANLPSNAHDKIHAFFDGLQLPPGSSPGGVFLQPNKLQAAVRGSAKPAMVVVDGSGNVTFKLQGESWK